MYGGRRRCRCRKHLSSGGGQKFFCIQMLLRNIAIWAFGTASPSPSRIIVNRHFINSRWIQQSLTFCRCPSLTLQVLATASTHTQDSATTATQRAAAALSVDAAIQLTEDPSIKSRSAGLVVTTVTPSRYTPDSSASLSASARSSVVAQSASGKTVAAPTQGRALSCAASTAGASNGISGAVTNSYGYVMSTVPHCCAGSSILYEEEIIPAPVLFRGVDGSKISTGYPYPSFRAVEDTCIDGMWPDSLSLALGGDYLACKPMKGDYRHKTEASSDDEATDGEAIRRSNERRILLAKNGRAQYLSRNAFPLLILQKENVENNITCSVSVSACLWYRTGSRGWQR